MSTKTKICEYCRGIADTKDHVPSKSLLERPFPKNLLTINCCKNCNNSFSLDEEYFLNVLTTLSLSPTLVARTEPGGSIYKSRERSDKLYNRIISSLLKENGKTYFKPESNRLNRVIEKYAFGLYYFKYKKIAALNKFKSVGFYPFNAEETRPNEVFMLTHTEKFSPKKWNHIQNGVFSYIIVRDWRRNNKLTMILHIHNTAWCVIEIPSPQRGKNKIIENQTNLDFLN